MNLSSQVHTYISSFNLHNYSMKCALLLSHFTDAFQSAQISIPQLLDKTQILVQLNSEPTLLTPLLPLSCLVPRLILHPIPMHGYFLLHPLSNSQIPAACPTIQPSSDTIYLEIVSHPTDEGFSPITLPTLQFQTPITNPGCLTGYRLEVFMIPFMGLINLLKQLIELR